jgi:competence protein ComEA
VETEETRAEIARRRLAHLVASFEQHVPPRDPAAPGDPDDPDEATASTGSRPAVADAGVGAAGAGHRASPVRRRLTSLHVRVVAVLAVAAVVVLAWSVLSGRPQSEPAGGTGTALSTPLLTPGPADDSPAAGEDDVIVVDVAGLVQRPGIVTLPTGSRVHEAIEAAGGTAGQVDLTGLNLARRLVDGEQVLVGVAPVAPAGAGGPAGGAGRAVPISLSTATLDQLEELPGVGPVTAQAIIDWRTANGSFTSVDDLLEVRGIGEATLSRLRDLVTP